MNTRKATRGFIQRAPKMYSEHLFARITLPSACIYSMYFERCPQSQSVIRNYSREWRRLSNNLMDSR